MQIRTDGAPSTRASVAAIWGPKALEHLVELELAFVVEVDAAVRRRLGQTRDDGWVLPLLTLTLSKFADRGATEARTR